MKFNKKDRLVLEHLIEWGEYETVFQHGQGKELLQRATEHGREMLKKYNTNT